MFDQWPMRDVIFMSVIIGTAQGSHDIVEGQGVKTLSLAVPLFFTRREL